jgi:hypothetical protein
LSKLNPIWLFQKKLDGALLAGYFQVVVSSLRTVLS